MRWRCICRVRSDARSSGSPTTAHVVEVLERRQYEWAHIRGAIHIPLWDLEERAHELERDRPVVVYCSDHA